MTKGKKCDIINRKKKRGKNMSKFLIVPRISELQKSIELAAEYDMGFEFNDFFFPAVLDSRENIRNITDSYLSCRLPDVLTSHGDFFDVIVFSDDTLIRDISEKRVVQSIEASRGVGADAVVFHTNHSPFIKTPMYLRNWENRNYDFWCRILEQYPDMSIYMENMFDDVPDVLAGLAERLKGYPNFGVCLDYAHACVFGGDVDNWVDVLHPYVKHLHINDNDLKEDLHLPVGDGLIDWEKFSSHFNRSFTECTVLIEVSSVDSQRRSAEYLRKAGLL